MKWGETSQTAGLTTLRGTWGVRHLRSAYVTSRICYYRANSWAEGITNDLNLVLRSFELNAIQI